jgi:hypothetical protein
MSATLTYGFHWLILCQIYYLAVNLFLLQHSNVEPLLLFTQLLKTSGILHGILQCHWVQSVVQKDLKSLIKKNTFQDMNFHSEKLHMLNASGSVSQEVTLPYCTTECAQLCNYTLKN